MAFYSMLSRASSSVLPLAIRTVRSSRTFHGAAFNFLSTWKPNLSRELTRGSRVPILHFSTETEATKQSADENLICVLESEIQCAKESNHDNSVQDTTDGLPFKIQGNPETRNLLLTREWQDEIIEVEGYIPHIPAKTYYPGDENDENDEDGNAKGPCYDTRIMLDVSVSKKSGLKLKFGVEAFRNRIFINHLSIKADGSEVACEGPESSHLGRKLEQAFLKYLEVRGIKPSIANFLPMCMVKTDSKEHSEWLKNLKNFIEH